MNIPCKYQREPELSGLPLEFRVARRTGRSHLRSADSTKNTLEPRMDCRIAILGTGS